MSIRSLRPGSRRTTVLALTTVATVALGLGLATLSADAAVTEPTPSAPALGNATWFDALGSPFGGCGVPQADLDTQNWIALNVYNTPGDYNMYDRPMTGANASKIGMWNNGKNCGRWVHVTIGDKCGNGGVNDGAVNAGFCHGGSWVSDDYNGAGLDMLVADSCGDPNGWCRDDPFHLDLAKASIDLFQKNGKPVGDLLEKAWGNRHINWSFIEAPNYTGDIKIGFTKDSQRYWTRIAITHLKNGIHDVDYWDGSAWVRAKNSSDMGQSFLIGPTKAGEITYKIRVTDITDQFINGGREYSFSLPASCGSQCSADNTFVDYTTSGGTTPTTTSPTTSTTSPDPTTSSPDPTTSTKTSKTTKTKTTKSKTTKSTKCTNKKCTTKKPVVTKKCKTGKNGKKTCTKVTVTPKLVGTSCAASLVTSEWNGGFASQVEVQAGEQALKGWTVTLAYPNGQQLTQTWGAGVSSSGSTVTASAAGLAAGATTSFGLVGTWAGENGTPLVTCSAS